MGDDAPARLDYLDATRALLWPESPDPATKDPRYNGHGAGGRTGDERSIAGRSGSSVDMVVLPSRRTARLLAPARPRRAGAAAALRYSAQQDLVGRIKGLVLAGGIQSGLIGRKAQLTIGIHDADRPSINDHLEAVLGEPVLTSLALTHDRANRKPVLQIFDRRGHTIAFAKVGVNELTRGLVDAEASALTELAQYDLEHVGTPAVLDHRRWNDLAVLVLSPMPSLSLRPAGTELIVRAMREVATTGVARPGRTDSGAAATYLADLRARAAAAAASPYLQQWRDLLEAEIRTDDDVELTFGAWHGDWARWNFVARGRRLAVWDWERYARPVPMGYDRLHYFLQGHVGPDRDRFPSGAKLMIERAPALLAPWSIDRRAAHTTALLYILDISLRYLADDQRTTGGGGAVEKWAFPTLTAALHL